MAQLCFQLKLFINHIINLLHLPALLMYSDNELTHILNNVFVYTLRVFGMKKPLETKIFKNNTIAFAILFLQKNIG